MKDNNSKMPDNIRPPFKLERELTLMPNEFRERMSTRHRNQKASTVRSGLRRNQSRNSSSTLLSARSFENLNGHQLSHNYNNDVGHQYPISDNYESADTSGSTTADQMSTIIENSNIEYDMDSAYNVAPSPNIMHIQDILAPFNEWNKQEVIREKKYRVLPSINKPNGSSTKTDRKSSATENYGYSHNPSAQMTGSYSNQLDYGRDKMEMEADFFADYRINTSIVKETPRQNPLPPIKQAAESPRTLGELRKVYRNVTSSSGSRQAGGKPVDNRHYKRL